MKRTVWLGIALGLAVVGAGAWISAPTLDELRRTWEMMQPLTDDELASVQRCDDPGWGALTKLLEQDLEDGCEPLWFASSALEHLYRRPGRRIARLQSVAFDPARPLRSRARAGLALHAAGHEPPVELAVIVQHPESGIVLAALVDALADQAEPPAWVDPWLALQVRYARTPVDALPLLLRIHAALVDLDEQDRRDALIVEAFAELMAAAFSELDLDPKALAAAHERAARKRSVAHLSPDIVELVHGSACMRQGSAACARRSASLLEELARSDVQPDTPPAPPALRALAELTRAREGSGGDAVETELELLRSYADYVGRVDPESRADRLLATVLGVGSARPSGARRTSSSVIEALVLRRPSPWMAAALVQALGVATEVDVVVGWEEGALVLRVGGREVWLDDCGQRRPAPPLAEDADEERAITPWPAAAVLAQAAAEGAREAHLAGDAARAGRLAGLALRFDPIGAEAARALLPGAATAAAEAGALLAQQAARTPEVASASRQARAIALQVAWEGGVHCPRATPQP